MQKHKDSFIKIGFIYAVGQVLSKALSFILLPIYTRQLGTVGYGQLALADTVLDFIGAFTILGVYSGYYRFYREYDEKDRRKLKNTAINFALILSVFDILLVVLIGQPVAKLIFKFDNNYEILILIIIRSILTQLVTMLMCDYTLNYKATIAVTTNLVNLILNLGFSIFFVVYLKQNIVGVYKGYIYSNFIIFIYLFYKNLKYYRLEFDMSMLKNMLTFSGGLILGNISSTILTLSDRYFLAGYKTYSETGVYSIGYKFGMLIDPLFISPFKSVFTPYKFQIWKNEDAQEKFNDMFNKYHFYGLFILLAISLYSKFIISIFTTKEFINAYKIVPLILFSYFLYGKTEFYILGIQIRNKTYISSFVILTSGICNLILNFLLIPKYGMYGATFATLISYIIINFLYIFIAIPMINIRFNFYKTFIYYLISFIIYLLYLSFTKIYDNITFEIIFSMILLIIYILSCIKLKLIKKDYINKVLIYIKTKLALF